MGLCLPMLMQAQFFKKKKKETPDQKQAKAKAKVQIEQKPTITGLGMLQLGKSYAGVMYDIGVDTTTMVDAAHDKKLKYTDLNKPERVVLVKYDYTQKPLYESMFIKCDRAYKVLIPSYKIGMFNLQNLTLKFYHDTLYSVQVTDPDERFIDAFSAKFNKPKEHKEVEKVKCKAIAKKDTFLLEETTFRMVWETNSKKIVCNEVVADYRDDNCDEKFVDLFTIFDSKIVERVALCEKAKGVDSTLAPMEPDVKEETPIVKDSSVVDSTKLTKTDEQTPAKSKKSKKKSKKTKKGKEPVEEAPKDQPMVTPENKPEGQITTNNIVTDSSTKVITTPEKKDDLPPPSEKKSKKKKKNKKDKDPVVEPPTDKPTENKETKTEEQEKH